MRKKQVTPAWSDSSYIRVAGAGGKVDYCGKELVIECNIR